MLLVPDPRRTSCLVVVALDVHLDGVAGQLRKNSALLPVTGTFLKANHPSLPDFVTAPVPVAFRPTRQTVRSGTGLLLATTTPISSAAVAGAAVRPSKSVSPPIECRRSMFAPRFGRTWLACYSAEGGEGTPSLDATGKILPKRPANSAL